MGRIFASWMSVAACVLTCQVAWAAEPPDPARGVVPLDVTGDESIYVVQPRAYSKRGRLEVTGTCFFSLNNKFVGYVGPTLSVAYHVRENLALELTSAIPKATYAFYSALVYEVRDLDPPLSPEAVDLKQMRYFGALSLQLSALYGKLNLYDWLVDYDFFVSAGLGLATTVEICWPEVDAGCSDEPLAGLDFGHRTPEQRADALKLLSSMGVGARIFFADFVGMHVQLRSLLYGDRTVVPEGTSTDIRNHVLLFLGASFLL